MKKTLTYFILFIVPVFCKAQFTDLYWPMGRNSAMDFRTNPVSVNLNDSNKFCLVKNTCTSICDRAGQLIFFSNGLKVYNRNGHIMPNGNNINNGTISNTYQSSNFYPPFKGAVVVPNPADTNKLLMFYSNLEYNIFSRFPDKMYYLVIDRNLDNGMGDVTIKDQVLIQNDTLATGEVMAVKHGDGKSWWILERNWRGNVLYSTLLDSFGNIHPPIKYIISIPFIDTNQINYCPSVCINGDKLVYLITGNNKSQIDLFDFDRCNGTVSNHKELQWRVNGKTTWMRMSCFSPDGNLLYLSDMDTLWQFDLQAANILGSGVQVGSRNLFSQLFLMKNAPDGKLYVGHYGSYHDISVIEYPNVKGIGCNFLKDTIHFGFATTGPWADGGLPNAPNLALGKLANCTIGIEEQTANNELLTIYPNPASQSLVISSKSSVNTIKVTNVLGQLQNVTVEKLTTENCQLNTVNLPSGIYFIKATDTNGNVLNGKFVKE